jgi:hypothetical protein
MPQPIPVIESTKRATARVAAPGAPSAAERKQFAAIILAVLIVVITGAVAVGWKRSHAAIQGAGQEAPNSAQAPASTAMQTQSSAEQSAATDKPSAAKPLDTNIAEDTVKKSVIPPTIGEAKITSNPEGAKVTIGGASQPKWVTPFTATKLQPGKYDVTVAKAGYVSQTKEIEVVAGQSAATNFDLVLSGATINVTSEPSGALIFLDGKATGKLTPTRLNVDKGKHKIEVRRQGFGEENTNVNLADGEKYDFSPTLIPKNATAEQRAELKAQRQEKRSGFFSKLFGGSQKIPAGKGMLSIKTTPAGATIIHNGKASPVQTPIRVPMDPGSYTVRLRLDGYKDSQQTFTIAEGKTTDLNVTLEKK